MISADFTPSSELAAGLQRDSDEGRPLYELVVPRRPIIEDLRSVPRTATFLATRGTAAGLSGFSEFKHLQAVWANPASPALLSEFSRAPAIRAVYFSQFKRLSDVDIGGAPVLEHLMLSWAPQLVSLEFLKELPALRTLYLEDMKRVDVDSLPELPQLRGLHLGGGMWSTLKVESLKPLQRLPGLRYLRLSNVRPVDGSLRPLGALPDLRELYLPNFFEVEEVASLAGLLPHVVSNTLTPEFGTFDGGVALSELCQCPTCGGRRAMMTGRPASMLCPACDAEKYRRRVVRWEIARATGWARSSGSG